MSLQGNIFITDEGHATITDSSVHTFASKVLFRLRSDGSFPSDGPSVYHPPELLSVGTDAFVERTRAMDVYSFALTTLAVSHIIQVLRLLIIRLRSLQGELHPVVPIPS